MDHGTEDEADPFGGQPSAVRIGEEDADDTPAAAQRQPPAVRIANVNPIGRSAQLEGQSVVAKTAQENADEVGSPVNAKPAAVRIDDGNSGGRSDCPSGQPAAANLDDLRSWIEKKQAKLRRNVSWRVILSADLHRCERLGGRICPDIRDLVQVEELAEGEFKAVLKLANSYERGDKIVSAAAAVASDEENAIEQVCKELMIQRLLYDARVHYPNTRLRLAPNNWHRIHDMMRRINEATVSPVGQDQEAVLPTAVCLLGLHSSSEPDRSLGRMATVLAAYEPPAAHEIEKREVEIVNLLVSISANERGWAQTNNLKRMYYSRGGNKATWMRPLEELRRLVEPLSLLKFLQDHPRQFEVRSKLHGEKLDRYRSMIDEYGNPVALVELQRFLEESVQPAAHVRSESVPAADVVCEPGSTQDHHTIGLYSPILVNHCDDRLPVDFKSSGAQLLPPAAQCQLAPQAEHARSTVVIGDSPRYRAPEPHEVESRNSNIAGRLRTLSENAGGWVRLDYYLKRMHSSRGDNESAWMQPFAELLRLVEPETLPKFLQDRPGEFEFRTSYMGKSWDCYRNMIDEYGYPAAPVDIERFLGESVQPAAHVRSESVPVADVVGEPGCSQEHHTTGLRSPILVNHCDDRFRVDFKSSRTHPLPPAAQCQLPPQAEHAQSTVVIGDSPRYQAPEPHEVEFRNSNIAGRLKTLSENASGWVRLDSCDEDAELKRLVEPGKLWQFLLSRPCDFEVRAKRYEFDSFRAIAKTLAMQPEAPVNDDARVGNCTCGRCPPQWFEEGWTCRGLCHGGKLTVALSGESERRCDVVASSPRRPYELGGCA